MGERRQAEGGPSGEPRADGVEPPDEVPSAALITPLAAGLPLTVDDVALIYFRVDRAGAIRWANEPAVRLLRQAGVRRAAVVNLASLVHERERRGVRAALAETVDDARAEVVVGVANGGEGDAQRFLHLILSRDDTVRAGRDGPGDDIVVEGWDVSALIRRLRELEGRVVRDPRTGLANRTTFLDRLHHEIACAARSGTEVAVLVATVDALTTLSDTYGRDVAETVLAEIGGRLAAALRPGDTLAWIGGDEFAVICPDLAGPHQAMTVADRLRAAATEPLTVGGRQHVLTLSVGVAFAGEAGDPAATLLRRAGRSLSGPEVAALHR